MQWVYVKKHACKICVKYCLYVFANMAKVQKFEVISDKNSIVRCRISYFKSEVLPKSCISTVVNNTITNKNNSINKIICNPECNFFLLISTHEPVTLPD